MTAKHNRATGVGGYARRLIIGAAPDRVYGAVATLDGLRGWWTTVVAGQAGSPGGMLRFGFAGLNEQITMRVDEAKPPAALVWSCVAHTRDGEWTGSIVRFKLTGHGPWACGLDFRHDGIDRDKVAAGWEHFLASLAAYAERGEGSPYGSDRMP